MATDTDYPGSDGGNRKGEAFEHAKRAVEEARAFGTAVSSSVEDLGRTLDLRGRVDRHPIGMLLAAMGVGYVLGGGLFSPLTGKLLKIGMRLALVPIIKSQLGALAGTEGERPGESSTH